MVIGSTKGGQRPGHRAFTPGRMTDASHKLEKKKSGDPAWKATLKPPTPSVAKLAGLLDTTPRMTGESQEVSDYPRWAEPWSSAYLPGENRMVLTQNGEITLHHPSQLGEVNHSIGENVGPKAFEKDHRGVFFDDTHQAFISPPEEAHSGLPRSFLLVANELKEARYSNGHIAKNLGGGFDTRNSFKPPNDEAVRGIVSTGELGKLAVITDNNKLHILDRDLKKERTLAFEGDEVRFLKGLDLLLVTGDDTAAHFLDPLGRKPKAPAKLANKDIRAAASINGKTVVGSDDGHFAVLDENGKPVKWHALDENGEEVRSIRAAPKTNQLLITTDSRLSVVDDSGKIYGTHEAEGTTVYREAWVTKDDQVIVRYGNRRSEDEEAYFTIQFDRTEPTTSPRLTAALQNAVRHEVTPTLRKHLFEGKEALTIERLAKTEQVELVNKIKEHIIKKSDKAQLKALRAHIEPNNIDWATKWIKDTEHAAETGDAFKDARQSAADAIASLRADAAKAANKRWFKDPSINFEAELSAYLQEKAPAAMQRWYAAAKKASPAEGDLELAFIARHFVDSAANDAWTKEQVPDLAYGETLLKIEVPTVLVPSDKQKPLISKLARLGVTGDSSDLALLEQTLSVIDESTLNFLVDRNYTVTVARDSVANGSTDVRGLRVQKGIRAEQAESAHTISKNNQPHILLRTYVSGGKLQLDIEPVLYEIGHALDFNFKSGKGQLSQGEEFVNAFTAEHKYLPSYFHEQKKFFAQVYSLYARDPEQCARDFPLTTAVFKKNAKQDQSDWKGIWETDVVDGAALNKLQRTMRADTQVQTNKDPLKLVSELDSVNALREKAKSARQPLVLELEGEGALTKLVAKRMADHAVLERLGNAKGLPSFSETLVHIDAATFNDATLLRERLDEFAGGSGAFIYIDDLSGIKPSSAGFGVLREYSSKRGDLFPVVLAGAKPDREPLVNAMKGALRGEVKVEGVSPEQAAELVRNEALRDGYVVTDEAMAIIIKRLDGATHESALSLWGEIKQEQQARMSKLTELAAKKPEAATWILARDVEGIAAKTVEDPLGEIFRMVGQDKAKARVAPLMTLANLAKEQERLKIDVEEPARLNVLLVGDPGTGKTTFASLVAQGLFQTGFTKSKKFYFAKVSDLVTGDPYANVKKMWEDNINGAIFLDELHQLADTENGRLVLRAMIPYLTDKRFSRTAFFGAGYLDEILAALRSVDDGAERRFEKVPFESYDKPQLRKIADKKVADAKQKATPQVMDALMQNVDRRERSLRHPGNGGTVETELGLARDRRKVRLNELLKTRPLTIEDFNTLTLADVEVKPPFTVEQVWDELNATVPGFEEAKSQLRDWQYTVELNRELGQDPLTGLDPYFVLQGRSTPDAKALADTIAKLGVALDLVYDQKVVKRTGSDLLGGFVGDSTAKAVRKQFEEAWGNTLYLEQLGAVGNARGGFEEQAGPEIAAQLKAARGHALVVLNDTKPNVESFFRLNSDLRPLFEKNVFELKAATTDSNPETLYRVLDDMGLNGKAIARGPMHAAITRRLSKLAENPAWEGKTDIAQLASRVKTVQARLVMASRKSGKPLDVKNVQDDALKTALDEIERKVSERPDPNAVRKTDDRFKFATQKAEQVEKKTDKVEPPTDPESQRVLKALSDVNKMKAFKDLANTNAEAFKALQNDPNGAYMKEVAKQLGLGTDTKAAQEVVVQVRVKVKKFVEVNEKKLVEQFSYLCPFCGKRDDPGCLYINETPAWKYENSLEKAWTEEITVKSVKEIEVEELQEKRIPTG